MFIEQSLGGIATDIPDSVGLLEDFIDDFHVAAHIRALALGREVEADLEPA